MLHQNEHHTIKYLGITIPVLLHYNVHIFLKLSGIIASVVFLWHNAICSIYPIRFGVCFGGEIYCLCNKISRVSALKVM